MLFPKWAPYNIQLPRYSYINIYLPEQFGLGLSVYTSLHETRLFTGSGETWTSVVHSSSVVTLFS